MKRFFGIFLLLLFAYAALSCGSDKAGENTETSKPDSGAPDEGEVAAEIRDSLPDDLDFGGETLTMHVRKDGGIAPNVFEFYVEGEIGDIVNDIIYRRNKAVEDRLNIKMNVLGDHGWEAYDQAVTHIRTNIMAGDATYDLIAGWSARIPALSVQGLLMDLYELPYIKLSEPWWNQIITEELTINKKLNFAVGDGNSSALAACMVMFVNNSVQREYGLPNLYDVVFEGNWTLDYMGDLIKSVSKDLNGDGIMDENDLYGAYMTNYNQWDGFMQASNIKMTKKDPGGMPYLDVEYDKLANLVGKVYSLVYENAGSYVKKGNVGEDSASFMFENDQVLLWPGSLVVAISNFRSMESDYSIIPYPKYDTVQEQYFSRIQDAVSLFCVPNNCVRTELVGAFMEAVSSESYKNVSPAYFDVAMKIKYARDETSAKMLDMIREGAYLNFAGIYNESIGYPWHVMRQLMSAKSNNFASWWEKNEPKIVKAIDKLVAQMENN